MSLTKAEISDLNSYIGILIEAEKSLVLAEQAKQEAWRQLKSFIYKLESNQPAPQAPVK